MMMMVSWREKKRVGNEGEREREKNIDVRNID